MAEVTLRTVIRACGTCEGSGIRPGYKLEGELCRFCSGYGHRFDGSAREIRATIDRYEKVMAAQKPALSAVSFGERYGHTYTCENYHPGCSSAYLGECGR